MNSSQINLKSAAIKSEKHLYSILNTNKHELENIISNKADYYYSFAKVKKDKKGNVIYKDGVPKLRTINATRGKLNYFQKVISKIILSLIPLPENVKGAVKNESNISNAQAHLGNHYKFKTDIKNYFPSIHPDRVYKMFVSNGCSPKVAGLLTHITTNKHELPQGTPCSSAIANLVFVINDHKINDYCRQEQITHTRFVDDLTFSVSVPIFRSVFD